MEISKEQLKALLNDQRNICREHLWKEFNSSEFKNAIDNLDTGNVLKNRFHEVRDKMYNAPYPNDFIVIEKYSL